MVVRLNRYLSMCGVVSRRKADELIRRGEVRVNGLVVNELGYGVDTEMDEVEVLGRVLRPEKRRYIILNKPRLYLTALGKGKGGRRTIEELITDIPERVYPVGRLDYDAEGLLILTNDGELANRVLHPRYKLPKVYTALVKGMVSSWTLEKMAKGTRLDDGPAIPDHVDVVKYEGENTLIKIAFHEGRNRLVKRFLASFNHPVLRLKRIAVGSVKLGRLPRGSWRYMTEEELLILKKTVGLDRGYKTD
ncbi:MAG TPA: pseudouridine synthase [Thermodesulfobacteriota bacterium]|jgi:23S rRNA pseudouridine2605 synthase|nr:pseudouridine synthase [Thermodesulfobacteriota bacterium]